MFPFYRGNPPPVLVGGCLIFYIFLRKEKAGTVAPALYLSVVMALYKPLAPRCFRALPAAVLRAGLRKRTKDRQSCRPCCLLPGFLRLVALVSLPPFYAIGFAIGVPLADA